MLNSGNIFVDAGRNRSWPSEQNFDKIVLQCSNLVVLLSLFISKTDMSGIVMFGFFYYRKRCANRAKILDSFEGLLILSPLAD